MNRRLLALFVLLFAALAVIAAPVDGNILETRVAKKVAKPKAVTKPKTVAKPKVVAKPKAVTKPKATVAKPKAVVKPKVAGKPKAVAKPKTVAKPKVVPKPKTVATPKTVAKPKVAAKPKTVATPKTAAKPKVAAKPKTVTTPKAATKPKAVSKPQTATKPTTAAKKPATSCPVPARKPKPAVRRFLEYIGLRARSDPEDDGLPPFDSDDDSPPCTPISDEKSAKKAAKNAKQLQDAKDKADKVAAAEAAKAAAEAAKRPVGVVNNRPTKAVQCTNKSGALETVALVDIEEAVRLAQAGPLVPGNNAKKFPHVFNNVIFGTTQEEVNIPAVCRGKALEEQAVGKDMKANFKNEPAVFQTDAFNQFRVLITTPDAKGATTFCGVMTHGALGTGGFLNALCAEA
ncbi:hypothetical protein FB451DRAFT_1549467 [Mycena latifolia]|nr:hypothetical protein FB451DRAFT_1549467 [Mycena latifolia]